MAEVRADADAVDIILADVATADNLNGRRDADDNDRVARDATPRNACMQTRTPSAKTGVYVSAKTMVPLSLFRPRRKRMCRNGGELPLKLRLQTARLLPFSLICFRAKPLV